ncbi:MAG: helix-turn-helix transcriptional regulator [Actinomycetota bacterium]|nr:helix-turn-helix transcriptional regulator [Actinomycetota bacterium]
MRTFVLRIMTPNDVRTGFEKPTDEERAVASLLVTGMTDEMAARRLGLSRRTFRRRLKALMDKLGARSRFQAGFMLAEAGWASDRPRDQEDA